MGESQAFSSCASCLHRALKGHMLKKGCWVEAGQGLGALTLYPNQMLWIDARVVICSF